jgi:hypothetical protein
MRIIATMKTKIDDDDWRQRDDEDRRRRDDATRHRGDVARHLDGRTDRCHNDTGRGRQRGHGRAPTPFIDVTCQICKIHGHPANSCWWCYRDDTDNDDDEEEKAAHIATYQVDTNWYSDSVLLTTSPES